MKYQPFPIDTSEIVIPPALTGLTEKLAENVHEIWADQRLQEGWVWGPTRNDTLKQHPCLVSYSQLPESEKEYDRGTALGTLKAIFALGYRISKPPD
jgi:hypothetical protein